MTRELSGLPAVFWPNWQAAKRKDVPLDGQAAHVLVATAQARARVAAVGEAVDPGDLAGPGYHGPLDRPEAPPTPGEDR